MPLTKRTPATTSASRADPLSRRQSLALSHKRKTMVSAVRRERQPMVFVVRRRTVTRRSRRDPCPDVLPVLGRKVVEVSDPRPPPPGRRSRPSRSRGGRHLIICDIAFHELNEIGCAGVRPSSSVLRGPDRSKPDLASRLTEPLPSRSVRARSVRACPNSRHRRRPPSQARPRQTRGCRPRIGKCRRP